MNLRQQQFQDMLNTSDPTMGTIYFLLSVDGPNSKVKIGRTGNINEFSQTRLKQLQVGNANKLILIGFLKGRETYYQIKFEEYWIRGEWFDFHRMKDKLFELDLQLPAEEEKHYSHQCVRDFARDWKTKIGTHPEAEVREVILDLVREHNIRSPYFNRKMFTKYIVDFKMNHYGNTTTSELMGQSQ